MFLNFEYETRKNTKEATDNSETLSSCQFLLVKLADFFVGQLVSHEQLEGLVELIVDVLGLHLLRHQVRDDRVYPALHRRRINSEEKAKVVVAVGGRTRMLH